MSVGPSSRFHGEQVSPGSWCSAMACLLTSSEAQKGLPPLHRGSIWWLSWPRVILHTHLGRAKEYTVSLKQGEIFLHKVMSPVQAVSRPSPGKEILWAQGPFLWGQEETKTVHRILPFPASYIVYSFLFPFFFLFDNFKYTSLTVAYWVKFTSSCGL